MEKLTKEQEINLLRIEKARIILVNKIETGLIKKEDLVRIFDYKTNYGVSLGISRNPLKSETLKEIYNCPFLLYGCESLDDKTKKLLQDFVVNRYNNELNELKYLYKDGQINKNEYDEEKKLLKFYYFNA